MRKIFALATAAALAAAGFACGTNSSDHTLTVVKAGAGTGTVTGGGIDCGSSCSGKFADAASVTLTAAADAGATFSAWSGCDSATGAACTVKMTGDRTVTATFNANALVQVTEDVTTASTWATGSTYVVTKTIRVTAPLVVQPGVMVRVASGASLTATAAITAEGTATAPVVFTATDASSRWGGIRLLASGSSFKECAVLYTGAGDVSGLEIGDGMSASVQNCVFAHHQPPTDSISSRAALDASGAAAGTVISANTFFDDRVPLAINSTFSPGVNAFDNAAAAPANPQPNQYNGIFVTGCAHVKSAVNWIAQSVAYVVGNPNDACNYLVVDSAGQLTVGGPAGQAVVKFFPGGRITASGVLAGKNAVFTSINDDRAGDTNGKAQAAAGGDWEGIGLSAAGSSFDHVTFAYAGGEGRPALDLGSYAATVTNSTFAYNRPPTAAVTAAPALDASGAPAGATLGSNVFYGNRVPLAMNTTLNIDDSNAFSATDGGATVGNQYQAIIVTGCGHFPTAITWTATKVPLLVGDPDTACNYLVVDNAGQLTIGDGVVVKFHPGGRIEANGVITANAATQIVFTSYADDAHGGDTNADGAASAAAGGDWHGLSLHKSGSSFDKVLFLYGGGARTAGSIPALAIGSGIAATVKNSVFAHNRTQEESLDVPAALAAVEGAAATVIQGNRFFDNTLPLSVSAVMSLDDTNEFDSGVASALQPNLYPGVLVQGCGHVEATTWLLTKVPLVVGWSTMACNYLIVDGGKSLTIAPNVVVKFWAEGRIEVSAAGHLTIDPTAHLTAIKDDHLTDTNRDNGAGTPSTGDWHGVKYFHASSPATCDHSGYMHYEMPDSGGACGW